MRNLIAFFLILLILIPSFGSQAEKFSVGWEIWYPFQFRGADDKLVGLDYEIFSEILQLSGDTGEFVELPWQRHLNYIETGDIDIAMGSSKNEDREKYAYFSEPYRLEKVVLVVRKGQSGNINIPNLKALSSTNYLVGVEFGYYYGDDYQELIKVPRFQDRIVEVLDIEQNVNMLIKKRIDGLLADPITINAFVTKYDLAGELEIHPLDIYESKIHLMLSKASTNKEQLERLNKAIRTMKETGRLNELLDKYSLD